MALLVGCHRGVRPAERLLPLTQACPLQPNPVPPVYRKAVAGRLSVELVDYAGTILTGHPANILIQGPSGARQHRSGRLPLVFDSLPPGRYVVQSTSLGFNVRVDTARVADNTGVALQLAVSPAPLDACGSLGMIGARW
jgi:hypothetical protein